MNKKKRIAVIAIILTLLLCISASVIGILSSSPKTPEKPKEPEIPKITEDFKEIELVSKLTTDGKIYFDDDTKNIVEYKDSIYYIIGNNGKIFNDKILDDSRNNSNDDKPYATSKNYSFYSNGDYCYYVNNKTKKKSKDYDTITVPHMKELYGTYVLLETYDEKTNKRYQSLLNTNDGTITNIDTTIGTIYFDAASTFDVEVNSLNYFTITNTTNKAGLIDHNGKVIIDLIYDDIKVFNDKYIFASKNNKYGVINLKNEEIIPFEYTYIYSVGNFIVLQKDNKISIANSNMKIYIDSKIDNEYGKEFDEEYFDGPFGSKSYNNKLYLRTYYNGKTSIYLINSKNIERKISTTTTFKDLYDYTKQEYIFTFEDNSNKETLTFYDYDLYEYFKTELDRNKNVKTTYEIYELNKTKGYYQIYAYTNVDELDKAYYIDLINSKQIDEYTAKKEFFSNGYNFYISEDKKLRVYKDKELLNEFEGDYKYLGGYLFLKDNNEIFEVTFKKDSTTK